MIWYAVLLTPGHPSDPAIQSLQPQLSAISPRVALDRASDMVVLTLDLGRLTIRQLVDVASHLHAFLHRAPLALTLGIAQNPIMAQIAAHAAPHGSGAIIPPGREAAFLAPLPIRYLPIDPDIVGRLYGFGLYTIGDVARLSRSALQGQFGFVGLDLHDLAHGRAMLPLNPHHDAPEIAIRRRFSSPVTNRLALEAALTRLAALLAARLTRQGWGAQHLTLVVECEPGSVAAGLRPAATPPAATPPAATPPAATPPAATPPAATPPAATMALASPTSDLALLTGALRQLLGACLPGSGVLALRVVASDLTKPQTAQLTLFPEPVTSRAQVAAVVANLSPRVRGQIYQAQLVAPQARCPEQQVAILPWEGV